MDTSTKSTWIIAGAVLFAGILIAAGVFFSNNNNNGNTAGGEDPLVAAAVAAGVDADDFETCISSNQFQSDVEEDLNNAVAAGARGTPFNVLVSSDPLSAETQTQLTSLIDGIQVSEDGRRVVLSGSVPYAPMTQIIDIMLADADGPDTDERSADVAINLVDEDDHIRGNIDAEVVLVEYSDFFCPFCGQFHDTMKQIIDTYEADQVAWVYRHFPIPQLQGHEQAPLYAQASECIADLGGNDAFWSFSDSVFADL
ncbi:MAG: thioredoxin domain-containing protein [Candidatus Paceibacterota bacterium]